MNHDKDEETALMRRLTSAQVSMIGLSGALGTGLFLGSGSTIALGGPATVVSYAIAGLLALAVVWALAEMVSTHPVPGGHGAVTASYLGRLGGYVARWNYAVTMLIAVGAGPRCARCSSCRSTWRPCASTGAANTGSPWSR